MKWTAWLKEQGFNLGVMTGQDRIALEAVSVIWELLSQDSNATKGAVEAVVALLPAMQQKCWPMARELVARSMDWSDRERIWDQLADQLEKRAENSKFVSESSRFDLLLIELLKMEPVHPR